jgi:hypothetical protein
LEREPAEAGLPLRGQRVYAGGVGPLEHYRASRIQSGETLRKELNMRTVLALALLVLLSFAGIAYGGQNSGASIVVDVDGLTPGDGGTDLLEGVGPSVDVDIAIYVYDATNLAAYEIKLTYDPAKLDLNLNYTTADNGRDEANFLNSLGATTPVFIKTVDGEVITLANAIQNATPENSPEGSGLLAIVSFTTKDTFSEDQGATFGFQSVELMDADGASDMATDTQPGYLNVREAVEPCRWGQIKAMF